MGIYERNPVDKEIVLGTITRGGPAKEWKTKDGTVWGINFTAYIRELRTNTDDHGKATSFMFEGGAARKVTGKTKKQAEDKLKAYANALAAEYAVARPDGKTMTLAQCFTAHNAAKIKAAEKGYYAIGTIKSWEKVQRRAMRALGDTTPIQNIRPDAIEKDLRGPRVIDRHAMEALHAALKYAVTRKWLAVNPADQVEKLKVRRKATPFSRDAIADHDLAAIFSVVVSSPYKLLFFYLLAMRGLRLSEILGLRWQDYDQLLAVLRIRAQAKRYIEQDPDRLKTYGSKRMCTLGPTIIALFEAHRVSQGANSPHALIFPAPEGGEYHPDTAGRNLIRRTIVAAGLGTPGKHADKPLGKYTSHWFRHTVASKLRTLGMATDDIGQELGHRDKAREHTVTEDYIHLSVEPRRAFVAPIEAWLNGLLPHVTKARLTAVRPISKALMNS